MVMKTPPLALPILRIGAALLTAAICFQVGRGTGQLEGRATIVVTTDTGNDLITPKNGLAPVPETIEPTPVTAAGDPVGVPAELITPLNVRDASALVMRPEQAECRPGAVLEAPKLKLKKEPLPEGRLLDLMKKHEDKPNETKVY